MLSPDFTLFSQALLAPRYHPRKPCRGLMPGLCRPHIDIGKIRVKREVVKQLLHKFLHEARSACNPGIIPLLISKQAV